MADYRAIWAVSEAIVNLLRTTDRPPELDSDMDFKVFTTRDFASNTLTSGSGASLFPYRIYINGTNRAPPGRFEVNGEPVKHRLPVEVHFLITVWGKEASLQNTLAGWLMRTLEDQPVLPATVLNSVIPNVFHRDETVEICMAELRTEDLFRIWDVLGLNIYQLSIPYLARVIEIDSVRLRDRESGELIQDRSFEMAGLGSGTA
ncbi:MAG: DUF4255 domain-containing protein [Gammaproteobacteria bacterium]|nr:DUF4255 domain-containing protein [Gammaproteobacteria bacterium]MDH5653094.1 DUF4255 domain-containing protein [Gammaproteobacteria bacterium]